MRYLQSKLVGRTELQLSAATKVERSQVHRAIASIVPIGWDKLQVCSNTTSASFQEDLFGQLGHRYHCGGMLHPLCVLVWSEKTDGTIFVAIGFELKETKRDNKMSQHLASALCSRCQRAYSFETLRGGRGRSQILAKSPLALVRFRSIGIPRTYRLTIVEGYASNVNTKIGFLYELCLSPSAVFLF